MPESLQEDSKLRTKGTALDRNRNASAELRSKRSVCEMRARRVAAADPSIAASPPEAAAGGDPSIDIKKEKEKFRKVQLTKRLAGEFLQTLVCTLYNH
jgi:hypothetical protein